MHTFLGYLYMCTISTWKELKMNELLSYTNERLKLIKNDEIS